MPDRQTSLITHDLNWLLKSLASSLGHLQLETVRETEFVDLLWCRESHSRPSLVPLFLFRMQAMRHSEWNASLLFIKRETFFQLWFIFVIRHSPLSLSLRSFSSLLFALFLVSDCPQASNITSLRGFASSASTAADPVDVDVVLRKFFKMVHPDLFLSDPKKKEVTLILLSLSVSFVCESFRWMRNHLAYSWIIWKWWRANPKQTRKIIPLLSLSTHQKEETSFTNHKSLISILIRADQWRQSTYTYVASRRGVVSFSEYSPWFIRCLQIRLSCLWRFFLWWWKRWRGQGTICESWYLLFSLYFPLSTRPLNVSLSFSFSCLPLFHDVRWIDTCKVLINTYEE